MGAVEAWRTLSTEERAEVVIVGTGMAGYTLAQQLRQAGFAGSIEMITTDDGTAYAKPKLSNAFTQGKTAAELEDNSAAAMGEKLQLRVRPFTLVTSLDTEAHSLTLAPLETGQEVPPDLLFGRHRSDNAEQSLNYGSLVLATGSAPVRLPLEGPAAGEVLSVNSLTDYRLLRRELEGRKVRRVAVIGPGLVGCEFANDLLHADMQVSVIGPDPWPLSLLIPEPPAELVRRALAERGVRWHLGTVNGPIEHCNGGFGTTLKNGERVEADLFLSAVGTRPEIQLARNAGIETATGICTDAALRTSAEDVYSLGDAAEIEGVVRLYIAPMRLCARALAQTLSSGEPTEVRLPPQPVGIKTSIHPINLLSAGPGTSLQAERWKCESDDGGCIARYYGDDGELRGFVLTGDKSRQRNQLLGELPAP